MSELTITVPGNPRGQPRPRFVNRGSFTSVYNPDHKLDKAIKAIIKSQVHIDPTSEPVEAEMIFYMPIVKSVNKRDHKLMAEGKIKHIKKPDVDNAIKKYLDGLTGAAYVDDNQVWKVTAEKRYSDTPRVEITITWGDD